jgi:hypothetical protein
MSKNPARNYEIEWILKKLGITDTQVSTAVASAIAAIPAADATGAVYGDVVGALLGPLLVAGIHGSEIAPPALVADVDAYAPAGGTDALYWNLDLAGFAVDGIAAPEKLGEVHVLRAVTAGPLHHDNAATPEDGILCPGDVDLNLDVDTAVVIAYLGTPNRWQVISVRGAPGTDGQDGLPGLDGNKGDRGDRGGDGQDGLPGLDGMSVRGAPGTDGRDGLDGLDGNRGPIGMIAEQDHGTVGAAESINFNGDKDIHRLVLGANCTLSPTGLPASPVPSLVWIILTQPAAGGPYTVAWWAGINWKAGVAPTLSTAANSFDLIGMLYDSINGTYTGFVVGTVTGPQGPDGPPGMDGLPMPGPRGNPGDPGIDGLDGMGSRGVPGVDGQMGLDGLDGNGNGGSSLTVKDVTGAVSGVVTEIDVPAGALSITGRTATLRQVPVGFIGARCESASSQTITSGAFAALTFSAAEETTDTDGFHEGVTNPTRFTVPAGCAGRYLVGGSVTLSSSAANQRTIAVKKNGATYYGVNGFDPGTTVTEQYGSTAAMLELNAGDYIEIVVRQDSGGNLSTPAQLYAKQAWLYKLDAGRVGSGVGARAKRGSATAITTATWTVVPFDAEDHDTDGFHSTSVNTSRMTVPPGMGGLYLVAATTPWDNSASGSRYIAITLNGALRSQLQQLGQNASGQDRAVTDVIKLAAGDYVEISVYQDSGGNLNVQSGAWFTLTRLDQGAFGSLASAKQSLTGGNQTTASAVFVDVTNASQTIVTGARRCLVTASIFNSNNGQYNANYFDIEIDGARVGGADGIAGLTEPSALGGLSQTTIAFTTDVLAAGSHTFKLKVRVSGGTGTIAQAAGQQLNWAVQELPDAGSAAAPAVISQVVRGRVNSDGTVAAGTGFTSVKNSTGNYTVTFTTPFSQAPIVVASSFGFPGAIAEAYVNAVAAGSMDVLTGQPGTSFRDSAFMFIAMSVA